MIESTSELNGLHDARRFIPTTVVVYRECHESGNTHRFVSVLGVEAGPKGGEGAPAAPRYSTALRDFSR